MTGLGLTAFAALGLSVTPSAQAQSVQNGSFEAPAVGTGSYGAFAYLSGTNASWTYTSGAGVAGNGSGFTYANAPAPDGEQVAFLQGDGTIGQDISFTKAGQYHLTFDASGRSTQEGANPISVLFNGSTLVSGLTPGLTNYQHETLNFSVASPGTYSLLFKGQNAPNVVGSDKTTFIDNVQVVAPEPSSVAAFAFTGLGAMGLMLRARKARRNMAV